MVQSTLLPLGTTQKKDVYANAANEAYDFVSIWEAATTA